MFEILVLRVNSTGCKLQASRASIFAPSWTRHDVKDSEETHGTVVRDARASRHSYALVLTVGWGVRTMTVVSHVKMVSRRDAIPSENSHPTSLTR